MGKGHARSLSGNLLNLEISSGPFKLLAFSLPFATGQIALERQRNGVTSASERPDCRAWRLGLDDVPPLSPAAWRSGPILMF
jgi:hypothetical protein